MSDVAYAPSMTTLAGSRPAVVTFLIRLVREKPLGAVGGAVFLVFLLCGIFADFLAPYGVTDLEMPATPQRVWQAINAGRQAAE